MVDLVYPVDGPVREWPGARGRETHYGTDWALEKGTPLAAVFDGVVIFVGGDGAFGELYPGSGIYANGPGLTLELQRADGLVARYGHLDRANVSVGDRVRIGQPDIARSGNSGFTTGPHLHLELRWDRAWAGGAWADPRDLGAQPLSALSAKPTLHGMENDMIVFYAHALGKGKPGWLVLGYTPKPLILSTQASANDWSDRIGKKTISTGYAGFRKYLRAAGAGSVRLATVSKG